MHWRIQQIFHGLSRIRHAVTDKRPGHLRPVTDNGLFIPLLESAGGRVTQESANELEIQYEGNRYMLRKAGSDMDVFREIFWEAEYAPLVKCIQLNRLQIYTGVDIGANIGLATRYLLNALQPKRWMCVEPFEANMAMCRRNNRQHEQVVYREAALWHVGQQQVYLHRNFRDGADWAIAASEKPEGEQLGNVSAISLADILATPGFEKIDQLKVDIEGAVHVVFAEKNTRAILRQVQVFCIEIHREPLGYKKLYDWLQQAGFHLFETGNTLIGINKGAGHI